MRKLGLTLFAATLAGSLTVGCGGSSSNQDAAVDAPVATGDMTASTDGGTTNADLTMGSTEDLTMTGGTPDMTTFSGTVALSALTTNVPLPLGDGGVGAASATVLVPTLGFGGGMPGNPTVELKNPNLFGCSGAHYDAASNHLPGTQGDAGKITITKYKGGTLLTGQTAPSEIDCTVSSGKYACTYGPIPDGGATANPGTTPYMPGVSPMMAGSPIEFILAGGTTFGAIDTMNDVNAADTVTVTEDLSKQKYTPSADVTFHATCPGGSCGATVLVVNLSATQMDPRTTPASPTFGSATCVGLASGGTITVSKAAIQAMLGCDANGANCDAALKFVQSAVVRFPLPTTKMDAKGNKVQFVAGQGVLGVAAQ